MDRNASTTTTHVDVDGHALPARLRALRLARGLSRQELADRAGLSARTVRDLESGRRARVQEKTVLLLAEACGVAPGQLLAPGAPAPPRPRRRRRLVWTLGALALVVATGAAALREVALRRAVVEIVDGRVQARDGLLGRGLWTFAADARVTQLLVDPWRDGTVLAGLDGSAADGGRLLRLERRSGRVVADVGPDVAAVRAAFGDEVLSEGVRFGVTGLNLLDLDGDAVPEVLVRFVHARYYPTILAVYDRAGRRLGRYLSRGHISEILVGDLDDDGRDEVIAAGTNNSPAFQGGTLIRLEEGFWSGATFDRVAGGVPSIPDSATARLVIPAFAPEIMARFGVLRLTARAVRSFRGPDGRQLVAASWLAHDAGVIVTCDADLRPLAVEPSDRFLGVVAAWPDSLKALPGFPDQDGLEAWLARAFRCQAGDWPPREASAAR